LAKCANTGHERQRRTLAVRDGQHVQGTVDPHDARAGALDLFRGGAGPGPDVEHPLSFLDSERADEIARGLREPGRVHPLVRLRDAIVGTPIVHRRSLPATQVNA
jgi:hypothetical protein